MCSKNNKITEIELKIPTIINMLLDNKNGIRGGITRVVHHNTEENNKCMYNFDKIKESTYFGFNSQCGWFF